MLKTLKAFSSTGRVTSRRLFIIHLSSEQKSVPSCLDLLISRKDGGCFFFLYPFIYPEKIKQDDNTERNRSL